MEYSDRDLVREIKAGNEEAMEILVRRWYPQVFGYVYKTIGREEDAYDVTQEVFLSVIRNIGSYLPLKKFSSWLFTIARNKCTDYFRTDRSPAFTDIVEAEPEDTEEAFDVRVTDAIVIEEIFGKLPPHQRETAELYFIKRFTAKQISQMTDTPLPTVKSRISTARVRLKDLLKEMRYE